MSLPAKSNGYDNWKGQSQCGAWAGSDQNRNYSNHVGHIEVKTPVVNLHIFYAVILSLGTACSYGNRGVCSFLRCSSRQRQKAGIPILEGYPGRRRGSEQYRKVHFNVGLTEMTEHQFGISQPASASADDKVDLLRHTASMDAHVGMFVSLDYSPPSVQQYPAMTSRYSTQHCVGAEQDVCENGALTWYSCALRSQPSHQDTQVHVVSRPWEKNISSTNGHTPSSPMDRWQAQTRGDEPWNNITQIRAPQSASNQASAEYELATSSVVAEAESKK
ncbi:hypothetical protein BKA67DRAFT_541298 [Truncatella angustata]|uniref:Uncharacterized protein n=1 Tax=Truncatella angustata TaxID=152316 RepID=A0A9P8RHW7_9PEZI|nr:uncharacterized protein BKA67DRAFT_541298 [Truncatella angustata]KAH6646329.1 hypothetical protein BKA67DRAFT_541298 [Truncatella angustata]